MLNVLLVVSTLLAEALAGDSYGYVSNNGGSYSNSYNSYNNNGGNSYGYDNDNYNGANSYGYGNNNNGGGNNDGYGNDGNNYGSNYGYDQSYDRPTPYSYGYETKDKYGTSLTRQEFGDGYGGVKGSYGYTDSYGLYRLVEYVADKGGFRARVKTNEPGIEKSRPAHVEIDGPIKAWAEERYKKYDSQPQYYSSPPSQSYNSNPQPQPAFNSYGKSA